VSVGDKFVLFLDSVFETVMVCFHLIGDKEIGGLVCFPKYGYHFVGVFCGNLDVVCFG